MKESLIRSRSYAFALSVVRFNRTTIGRTDVGLSRQLLRAATSIGANVEEASVGQSRRDFAAKMAIARKEAFECHYWLQLIRDSRTTSSASLSPPIDESVALCRILTSIVKSTHERVLGS